MTTSTPAWSSAAVRRRESRTERSWPLDRRRRRVKHEPIGVDHLLVGIRTVVVVALAAWVGWLLVRGVIRRKMPWIGIAIVAVPLIALFWTERQWVSAEQRFSAVSHTIEPASPGVHCQRLGEAFTYAGSDLGHVFFEDGIPVGPAVIGYEACQNLTAYWRSNAAEKSHPPLDQVIAVHVLSHESEHLRGIIDESLADCKAMQRDATTAQQLGATPAQGLLLARMYWMEVYPDLAADYVTHDCRENGPLDRTPDDGVWP